MPHYPSTAYTVESLSQRIDQLEMENAWLLDKLMSEKAMPKDAATWQRRHRNVARALAVCALLNLASLLVIVRNLFPD